MKNFSPLYFLPHRKRILLETEKRKQAAKQNMRYSQTRKKTTQRIVNAKQNQPNIMKSTSMNDDNGDRRQRSINIVQQLQQTNEIFYHCQEHKNLTVMMRAPQKMIAKG